MQSRQTQFNRWHVYNWLKESYMFSGSVPTERDCIAKFGGLIPKDEMEEGIIEFEITVREHVQRTHPAKQKSRGA